MSMVNSLVGTLIFSHPWGQGWKRATQLSNCHSLHQHPLLSMPKHIQVPRTGGGGPSFWSHQPKHFRKVAVSKSLEHVDNPLFRFTSVFELYYEKFLPFFTTAGNLLYLINCLTAMFFSKNMVRKFVKGHDAFHGCSCRGDQVLESEYSMYYSPPTIEAFEV